MLEHFLEKKKEQVRIQILKLSGAGISRLENHFDQQSNETWQYHCSRDGEDKCRQRRENTLLN